MRSLMISFVALGLCACGGPHHVDNPVPAPRGGGSGPAINGELNVFVIDSRTGAVIPGASVRVGGATDPAPMLGTTSGNGLVTFTDKDLLKGPQTITASFSNYSPATWIGVNGAVVTIPLDPRGN